MEGWDWKEIMGWRGLHCGGLGLEGSHGVEGFTLWRVGAGRKSWGGGVYTVEGWSWKENMGWGVRVWKVGACNHITEHVYWIGPTITSQAVCTA